MYKIKVSSDTVSVLKQLADINNTLRLPAGGELKSVASNRTIFAVCEIEENIPYDFNIYDMREFNQALALFDNPVLVFDDEEDGFLKITDESGDTTLTYWESDEDFITSYPKRDVPPINFNTEFEVEADIMKKVLDASRVLKLPYVGFQCDGRNVYLAAFSTNTGDGNETNSFRRHVCECTDGVKYNMFFEANQFRILNGTFKVEISETMFSRWENVESNHVFYLTLCEESEYNT